jgi:SAM-dependent methyltransferase
MLNRDRQPEILDDPNLPVSDQEQALAGLCRLNRFSGISGMMYRRIRRYVGGGEGTLRVLDIASGSGDIPLQCAAQARRDGLTFHTTMIDINEVAASRQRQLAESLRLPSESIVQDCLREPLPCGFDVITCSLFMHHLDDREAARLMQSMEAAKPRAILISDLMRSRFNLAVVGLASRLLSRSAVVHHDATASVRAAFTREEFQGLAEKALLRPVLVEALFPARFLVTIDDRTVPVMVPSFA